MSGVAMWTSLVKNYKEEVECKFKKTLGNKVALEKIILVRNIKSCLKYWLRIEDWSEGDVSISKLKGSDDNKALLELSAKSKRNHKIKH